MASKTAKFSDHFDTLVALISHMALMEYTSRTPTMLAKYLSLEEREVNYVLTNFKGIFRESVKSAQESGEKFYCLQIRYATRKSEDENEENDLIQLKAEYLNTLLEFVAKMVDIEKAGERQISSNWITIVASIIAFIASLIAIFSK